MARSSCDESRLEIKPACRAWNRSIAVAKNRVSGMLACLRGVTLFCRSWLPHSKYGLFAPFDSDIPPAGRWDAGVSRARRRHGYPVSPWFPLCVFSIASMVAFSFVVLRGYGLGRAVAGSALFALFGAAVYALQLHGEFGAATAWLAAAFAVILIFGVGLHILRIAMMSLRRGIINQHVLVEFGAFAGLAGGAIGLNFHPAGYPTVPFFSVAVMGARLSYFLRVAVAHRENPQFAGGEEASRPRA